MNPQPLFLFTPDVLARCNRAAKGKIISGTFAKHLYHIIFSAKNRENLININIETELYSYIAGIVKGEQGLLYCTSGTENHIHLLCAIHPSISVSEMVKRIKGNSSYWLNTEKKQPFHFSWQKGYASFAVSESSREKVVVYIQNQKSHHKTKTFKEDFWNFLDYTILNSMRNMFGSIAARLHLATSLKRCKKVFGII